MKINWANLKGPALILWTLILLGLLLTPFRDTVNAKLGDPPYFDKIAHVGLFSITGIIIFFGATRFKGFRSRVIFTIIFCLVLAVSTEIVQLLILLRNSGHNIYRHLWPLFGNVYYTPFFDFIADIVGLGLALILIAFLYHRTTFSP